MLRRLKDSFYSIALFHFSEILYFDIKRLDKEHFAMERKA